MDYIQIAGIIAILGGAGLILAALFMKAKVKKATGMGMFGAAILGIVLCAAGYYVGGATAIDNLINPPAQYVPTYVTPGTTVSAATFEITPTAQGNSGFTLNSDKTRFSLPIYAWTSTHVIKESDNTSWVDADMKFVIKPIPDTEADALDLATIYFEFNDPELAFTVASTSYYAFTKTGTHRNIEWNVYPVATYGTVYVSGSHSMLLTSPVTMFCNTTASNDLSRVENLYDPLSTSITFFNADHSWSETYGIDIFLMGQNAVV